MCTGIISEVVIPESSADLERSVPTVDAPAGRRSKRTCTVIGTVYQWKPEHLCTAETNVNTKNRIMDYDIRELGEQLMPLGMLVTLDQYFQPGNPELERRKNDMDLCR